MSLELYTRRIFLNIKIPPRRISFRCHGFVCLYVTGQDRGERGRHREEPQGGGGRGQEARGPHGQPPGRRLSVGGFFFISGSGFFIMAETVASFI